MNWLQNRRTRIATIVLFAVASAGAMIASTPAGTCIKDQTAVLLAGPYSDMPFRAVSSAQIMCARSDNIPTQRPFRKGLSG